MGSGHSGSKWETWTVSCTNELRTWKAWGISQGSLEGQEAVEKGSRVMRGKASCSWRKSLYFLHTGLSTSGTCLLPPSLVVWLQRDTALWHYWGVEGKALEHSTEGASWLRREGDQVQWQQGGRLDSKENCLNKGEKHTIKLTLKHSKKGNKM